VISVLFCPVGDFGGCGSMHVSRANVGYFVDWAEKVVIGFSFTLEYGDLEIIDQ
jgi:hypothetical protein